MHPSSVVGRRAMALSVTGARSAVLKDADFNSAARCRGPAHSLCAQNNEAVIPPVAMTIEKRLHGEY